MSSAWTMHAEAMSRTSSPVAHPNWRDQENVYAGAKSESSGLQHPHPLGGDDGLADVALSVFSDVDD